MDRPLTPTKTQIQVSGHELRARSAPGGRMPTGTASNTYGDAKYTPIHDASPAAIAAEQERQVRRERPELAAKRERAGK